MNYTAELKPRAIKDLKRLQKQDASRITDALKRLESDLTGDVKIPYQLHAGVSAARRAVPSIVRA